MIQSSIPTDTLHISGAQSVLTSNSFPNPQGHHARAVVRAYEKLFGRNPNWSELYYYTTMIRANPQSRAWYRQLSASQNGVINFSTGKFGSYTNTGGTGSGSGGPTATRVKARRQAGGVATEAGGRRAAVRRARPGHRAAPSGTAERATGSTPWPWRRAAKRPPGPERATGDLGRSADEHPRAAGDSAGPRFAGRRVGLGAPGDATGSPPARPRAGTTATATPRRCSAAWSPLEEAQSEQPLIECDVRPRQRVVAVTIIGE